MRFRAEVFVCMLFPVLLLGQSDRGTLTGTITDQTGAVVPGASVRAIRVDTNLSSTTETTSHGDYTIPQLPVGNYRVEIGGPGFKTLIRNDIVLTAGSTVRIDGVLEVGQVTESIAVSSQAALLATETAKVSTTVTQKLVEDLPLVVSGALRSPFDLALVAPEARNTAQFSIGGGQDAGWDLTVDGISAAPSSPIVQKSWAALNSPSVEAITEFAQDSNGFKAEFGHAGGGVISFVSKSGTNEFHGSAYEFLRNQDFDANAFFNNALRAPKPILKQSDFGFSLGGPVLIPKIYRGKDKTFFFVSYEGFRNRAGAVTSILTVPLPEMYQGNFSNWKDVSGNLIPIYDPTTTRSNGSGGWLRDPFPGNQIPTSRFSPVSKNVIQYATMKPNVPDPTGILNPNPRNNFQNPAGGSITPYDKFSVKLDHMLSTRDRFAFLFNWGTFGTYPLNGTPPGLPVPLNGFNDDDEISKVYRVTWDHTFTPTILNHFAFGYNNTWRLNASMNAAPLDATEGWGTKLGLQNVPDAALLFPGISMGGYNGWGDSNWGGATSVTAAGSDDLNIIRGSHTFKLGFTLQADHYDGFGYHHAAGTYTFNSLTTSAPLDQTGKSGNGFASMLLGDVYSDEIMTLRQCACEWRYWAFYVQDDWRATSKLTINYGLRYDYTPPTVEGSFPDGYSNFDPSVPNPGAAGRLGAMVYAGTGTGRTGSRTMFPAWRAGFGPRFGLAYSADSKTVIRMGAARSFGPIRNTGGTSHYQGFVTDLTWSSTDLGITTPFNWTNGQPAWPKPPNLDPAGVNNSNASYWQPYDSDRLPEFYSATFSVQRQLPGNMMIEAGYNATLGRHLTTSLVTLNQVDPAIFQTYVNQLGAQSAINLMSQNINSASARAAGVPIPWTAFNGSVAQALRPYPQYQNIVTGPDGGDRSGKSSYNALVLKFEKRLSNGLTFLNSYTFSKLFSTAESASSPASGSMDNYDRSLEKALASSDQTHVFKFSYSYELPFGHGRKYLARGVVGQIIGGWRVAGIQTYVSGFPLSVGPGYSLPLFSSAGDRLWVNSYEGWRATTKSGQFDPFVDMWWDRTQFNKTPQLSPPTGVAAGVLQTAFGDATIRNPKARGPWGLNENTSVARTFQFSERVKMDFRWEAFNLLNRVAWGSPDSTVTSNSFGRVTSQANSPRQMQFALKLVF